jgi:hypothetical protein
MTIRRTKRPASNIWNAFDNILEFVRCDAPQRERLRNHLTAIAQGLTRATALRQAAHRWLKQEQIVRPGHTTLRDVIVSARQAALQNVHAILARELSPKQMEEIEALPVVAAPVLESAQLEAESASRSRLEQFKAVARKESPESLLALLDQLSDVRSLGLTAWPALAEIHPATRRMLAGWGYRYSVWNLRRFSAAKRNGIVICFLQAARAEMTDALSRGKTSSSLRSTTKHENATKSCCAPRKKRGAAPSKCWKRWGRSFWTIRFQTTSCVNTFSICCRARISAD